MDLFLVSRIPVSIDRPAKKLITCLRYEYPIGCGIEATKKILGVKDRRVLIRILKKVIGASKLSVEIDFIDTFEKQGDNGNAIETCNRLIEQYPWKQYLTRRLNSLEHKRSEAARKTDEVARKAVGDILEKIAKQLKQEELNESTLNTMLNDVTKAKNKKVFSPGDPEYSKACNMYAHIKERLGCKRDYVSNPDGFIDQEILEDYHCKKVLRKGLSCLTFLCENTKEGGICVMKVIPDAYADKDYFENKLRSLSLVARPNRFPEIIDIKQQGIDCFLVMEYVKGKTLEKILESENRFTETKAVDIAIQVCQALEAAHDKGLTQLEIRPQIIVLDEQEKNVRLADFGIGDICNDEWTYAEGADQYIAPEIRRQKKFDHRADIYSLGTVLCKLLGFNSLGNLSTASRDTFLTKICKKATASEPERRFQTAQNMKEALEEWQDLQKIGAFSSTGMVRIESGQVQYWGYQYQVSSFCIDLNPVSYNEFNKFVQNGFYSLNKMSEDILKLIWTNDGFNWLDEHRPERGGLPEGNEPVSGITWYEAVAFCNWRSAMTFVKNPFKVENSNTAETVQRFQNILSYRKDGSIAAINNMGFRLPTEFELIKATGSIATELYEYTTCSYLDEGELARYRPVTDPLPFVRQLNRLIISSDRINRISVAPDRVQEYIQVAFRCVTRITRQL